MDIPTFELRGLVDQTGEPSDFFAEDCGVDGENFPFQLIDDFVCR